MHVCVCAWLYDVDSLGSQTEFAMFKRLRVNEAMEEKARRAMLGSASELSRKGRNKSRRQTYRWTYRQACAWTPTAN